MKFCNDYTKESFLFLVCDTILPPNNPLKFSKNQLKGTFSEKIKIIDKKI